MTGRATVVVLALALPACGGGGASQPDGATADRDDAGESSVDAAAVEGIVSCDEATAVRDSGTDASGALQGCIDRTPAGFALELEPGRYSLAAQLRLDRAIMVTTAGRRGTAACAADGDHGCAELVALPALGEPYGMVLVTSAATIDHIVLDGNRAARDGTFAHDQCSTLTDNRVGFNAALRCDGCAVQASVSRNALCGTGLLVAGRDGTAEPGREPVATEVRIEDNTFAGNGRHLTRNLWSDGLTVLDAEDSTFADNTFIDNTDIDLIFGGCQRCAIRGNAVVHTGDPAGGAFAAIMIQKWSTTSGSYEAVDVSANSVDCGPLRNCGSGLYIGSESWYDETPYGTLTDGETSGAIVGNSVTNAKNAVYIAARGLAIHGNAFVNAHDAPIPTSCGTVITSATPIVVSPSARSCHFNLENVDPQTSMNYGSASWAGCIPNYDL